MFIQLALAVTLLAGPSIPDALAAKAVTTITASAPRERSAGARFAAEASRRLSEGWRLAGIDVLDDGSELSLELVVARGDRAEQLTLVFDAEGERALAYVRTVASPVTEKRIYRFADELTVALSGGSVDSLFAECGSYFLEGAGGGASVDPYDYYVVSSSAQGAAARRLFASSIAGAIEDDMRVAGVIPSRRAVDVVLFKGHEEVVHAELDASGAIVAVEVRWSPVAYASWARTYTGDAELERALRAARSVDGLVFEGGAAGTEPRLVMRLATGARVVVDTADFAVDDDELEDFDCPC